MYLTRYFCFYPAGVGGGGGGDLDMNTKLLITADNLAESHV
jgi:hypothetical protein